MIAHSKYVIAALSAGLSYSALDGMIAMICNGGFRPGVDEVRKISSIGLFPEASREVFERSPRIRYNVKFEPGPIDYLSSAQQK